LSDSKVYFNKNDATNALKYMTSTWKYVRKVQIKNGVKFTHFPDSIFPYSMG
jgi:hypothetical protein